MGRSEDGSQRTGRFALGRVAAVAIGVLAGSAVAGPPAFADPVAAPPGWTVVASERLADGLERVQLVRRDPPQSIHVARLAAGAPLRLRTVLSNDAVAEDGPRLERTSSMCARAGCIVGVNADFAEVGTNEPLGATVAAGELLRSPSASHHQLLVGDDGRLAAGGLDWRGTLVPTDLRPLTFDAVNRPRGSDQLVLYTPAQGQRTGTNAHGIEVPFRVVQPAGAVRLGYTVLVELGEPAHSGNTAVPRDGGVLSGHGRGAQVLADLLRRAEAGTAARRALLRLETGASVGEVVGGSPILLREGRRWFADEPTAFVRGRHPRTAVGWTPQGDVFLVAADGRRPGAAEGLTLAELADVLAGLGASDAINLDGGGSTTFVVRGRVVNAPSDRAVAAGASRPPAIVQLPGAGQRVLGDVERPVVSALVVVPATSRLAPAAGALAGDAVPLPAPPPLERSDPASSPEVALPALVARPAPDDRTGAASGVALAALSVVAVAAVTMGRSRHRGRLPRP